MRGKSGNLEKHDAQVQTQAKFSIFSTESFAILKAIHLNQEQIQS